MEYWRVLSWSLIGLDGVNQENICIWILKKDKKRGTTWSMSVGENQTILVQVVSMTHARKSVWIIKFHDEKTIIWNERGFTYLWITNQRVSYARASRSATTPTSYVRKAKCSVSLNQGRDFKIQILQHFGETPRQLDDSMFESTKILNSFWET